MAGSGGSIEQRRRRRREKWLVILGVTLHAVYMLSIFDIYFKSPIVHGMDPVHPNFRAPAKRLVLLVADGLRADKFFESEGPSGKFRAPFLRNIIKERGRWGVSHARPPTESRPGHVSIIAGFYEDPSAVTKGWKANPVEFDSVFNQSRHTISYGSPDIVPIFCSNIQHSTWDTYPHDYEDFATDASFLDHWSLDQFKNLLKKSHTDAKLKQTLAQDKLVIFLHLLGCDTNGHAHKPFSPIYLNNVKVVDSIAKEMYELMESYFNDNGTAYIFTADHGMSDKGSHGDGHPTNTDTPLVAWGAGIKNPKYITLSEEESEISDAHGEHFVDDHEHGHTPDEWGLHGIQRLDVNQADIAPLMATLVGLPCPMNSVGNLPKQYLNLDKEYEVEAVLANTKQILNQFLRKSYLKQQSSLYLKPFKPLENYESALDQIQNLISTKDYDKAIKYTETLRDLALSGLHYYQTYDWLMLMTVITLGYIGWMINLIIHVLQSYALFPKNVYSRKNIESNSSNKVYIGGFILDGIISFILFLEKAPPLYHAYVLMTVLLWTRIMNNFQFIKALFGELTKMPFISHLKLMGVSFFAIFVLEFLVMSFSERRLYTWCFLCFGLFGAIFTLFNISKSYYLAVYIWFTCWFLSIFTLMPAEIPENNNLVVSSGALIILIALASKWIELYKNKNSNKFWVYLLKEEKKGTRFSKLFFLQVLLVGLSSIMVSVSTSHRAEKRQLLPLHQLINWFIAGSSMVLPLFSPKSVLSRLTSIFLGFAPPFLLLSIGYEAVFYGVFGLVLMGWILIESASIYSNEKQNSAVSSLGTLIGDADERCLQLSDLRIPLIFMVLFNIAFFGTGNFASIASFEISSVYRFITIFSPFLMSGLLIFKLFIPFILVICAFSAITKIRSVPRLGLYFIVILFSDVMTIHFFFLVRNKGSWMEIGNSISHFGIMSAQVVFVLMLFALTNIFTKDIQISTHHLSRKSV